MNILAEEKILESHRKYFEMAVIPPLIKEAFNPWVFFYLMPNGRKTYVRRFKKVPKVTWK